MAKPYIPYDGPIVTRSDAMGFGLKRFFTGKPCIRGHLSQRLVSSPCCDECLKAKNGTWARENPERHNAQGKAWREANPGKRHDIANKHRAKTLPTLAAREAGRRSSAKVATPVWADLAAITSIYKKCALVSEETGIIHHVDHIYPLKSNWVCGLHCEANLQILPASDNMRKSNRYVPELVVIDGKPMEPRRQGDLFLWERAA